MYDEGNNIGYMRGLVKKYGPSIIDQLYVKKHQESHLHDFQIKTLISDYQKKVDRLKEEKQLE